MTCYDVCVDFFVPLVSAFIGGFITLAGVWLTIRRDKKRDESNRIKDAKPWIFSLSDCENYEASKANDIFFATSVDSERKSGFTLVIKNTDNGICVLDKFITERKTYIPIVGRIIDKNTIAYLHIFFEEGETIKDMCLYIKDIYGNSYKYKVSQGKNKCEGNYIAEIFDNQKG